MSLFNKTYFRFSHVTLEYTSTVFNLHSVICFTNSIVSLLGSPVSILCASNLRFPMFRNSNDGASGTCSGTGQNQNRCRYFDL